MEKQGSAVAKIILTGTISFSIVEDMSVIENSTDKEIKSNQIIKNKVNLSLSTQSMISSFKHICIAKSNKTHK